MNTQAIQTLGVVIASLLGGGIIKAVVDLIRNRHIGKLEEKQFDFTTLTKMNEILQSDVNAVRKELNEERAQRRALEEELARERRLRQNLEARVEELEKNRGDKNG